MLWPGRSPRLGRHYLRASLPACEDIVDKTVLFSLFGSQDLVSLDVLPHLLEAPATVPRDDLFEQVADPHDLAGLDLDVAGLAVGALGRRLVDQDTRVRQ